MNLIGNIYQDFCQEDSFVPAQCFLDTDLILSDHRCVEHFIPNKEYIQYLSLLSQPAPKRVTTFSQGVTIIFPIVGIYSVTGIPLFLRTSKRRRQRGRVQFCEEKKIQILRVKVKITKN